MKRFVVLYQHSSQMKSFLDATKTARPGTELPLPQDIAASRQGHSRLMARLKEQGKLFCAGPFADFGGAIFIFEVDSRDEVQRIVQEDPYVANGFVTKYEIREWDRRI